VIEAGAVAVPPPPTIDPDWRGLLRRLGTMVYACRTVAGLSQDQLGRLAHTSQGAVSRVESGACIAIPLVTYARLGRALLQHLDPVTEYLTADLRGALDVLRVLGAIPQPGAADAVFLDDRLTRVFACMNNTTPEKRATFVQAMLLLAEAWFPDAASP
jgi:hypothetical protein